MCLTERDTAAHDAHIDLVCQRHVLTGRSHSSLRGVEASSRPSANEASSPRARWARLKVAQKVSRTRPQRGTETAAATPGPAVCGEALQRKADGSLRKPSDGQSGPCSVGRGAPAVCGRPVQVPHATNSSDRARRKPAFCSWLPGSHRAHGAMGGGASYVAQSECEFTRASAT